MADQRDLTQLAVETDLLQTDRQRRLTQQVVESDVNQANRRRQLFQIVIEVDVDHAGFVPIPPRVYLGSGIILLVNTGTWTAPVFEPLAGQRVVDFGEGNDVIDWSSKDSRFRRIMPGRYSSDVSAGGLYVPNDPPYLALQGAMRGHELILIRRCEDGIPIEDAIALVKAISIDAPDNDVGLMAVGLSVDGWWFPAV
jgi:hypothetical protein